jgi:hypothetical protein
MGHTVAERSWKDPTLCIFRVFSVAVMGKCCDACGDGDSHFLSCCLASRMAVIDLLRLPLTGSRWGRRWLSGRRKTLTLCVFPVNTVAVVEKCCDARGDGEYYFRSSSLATDGAGVSGASIVFDRKSIGQTVPERSWKDADSVCISSI